MFIAALAARSASCAAAWRVDSSCSRPSTDSRAQRAAAARSSALAASAAVPSTATSTSTSGSEKSSPTTSARPAVSTASNRYSALNREGALEDSTRATSAGTRNAESTWLPTSSAGDRDRAVRVVEDDDRQRDVAEPRAEPVHRVGEDDSAQTSGAREPAHRAKLSAQPHEFERCNAWPSELVPVPRVCCVTAIRRSQLSAARRGTRPERPGADARASASPTVPRAAPARRPESRRCCAAPVRAPRRSGRSPRRRCSSGIEAGEVAKHLPAIALAAGRDQHRAPRVARPHRCAPRRLAGFAASRLLAGEQLQAPCAPRSCVLHRVDDMDDMMHPQGALVCRAEGADLVVRKGQICVVPFGRRAIARHAQDRS